MTKTIRRRWWTGDTIFGFDWCNWSTGITVMMMIVIIVIVYMISVMFVMISM